ncbi:MAG: glycosyltransferase family 2 protein [Planctomycetota bacterium]
MIYSVCVIHFGDPDPTHACLAAVDQLHCRPHERCLVWNGPGAPSADFLREHPGWMVLAPPENLGYGAGANLGIAQLARTATVEAVLLLNNDAVLEADSLSWLIAALEHDPDIALVGPRILELGTGRIWHDGGAVESSTGRARSLRYGEADEAVAATQPVEVEFVCGCAPLIRVAAFRAVAGFDERYFLYGEDLDLSARLRVRGWKVMHESRARAWHHGSASVEAQGRPFSLYYRLRARMLFLREHGSRLPLGRCLQLRVRVGVWWRAARYSLQGRGNEARALRGALVDARRERWGRSSRFDP